MYKILLKYVYKVLQNQVGMQLKNLVCLIKLLGDLEKKGKAETLQTLCNSQIVT